MNTSKRFGAVVEILKTVLHEPANH